MEIKKLKNKLVPGLVANENWNWFIDKLSELPKDKLFSLLREGEQLSRVKVPIESLVTGEFTTQGVIDVSGKYIQVHCNCHDGTDAKVNEIYVSVNGVAVERGHYVTYTYDATTSSLKRTDYSDAELTFKRGTNTLMFNATTLELIEMLWVDTYEISSENPAFNEDASNAVESWISWYKQNKPNTICVMLNADAASCYPRLRATLASLGGLSEGTYTASRKRHYFIGNLNTPEQKAFEEISDDPAFITVTVPCKEGIYQNPGSAVFSTVQVLYALGNGYEPLGSWSALYVKPGTSGVNNTLWMRVCLNGVYSNPVKVRSYSNSLDSLEKATYTFGVSMNNDDVMVRYPSLACASIAAYTEGTLWLRLVEQNIAEPSIIAYSRVTINQAVLDSRYYLQDGTYKLDSGTTFDIKEGRNERVKVATSEVLIEKINYAPNMFTGLYSSLFGSKTFDIFSYTGLSYAQYLLGYPEHDVESGRPVRKFITAETPYNNGKLYSIRNIKILSRNTAYISEECMPYVDDENYDALVGRISYCATGDISQCKFKDVNLKILSYDKGIALLDGSSEDLDFLNECASWRANSIKSSAELVRKLHGYQFDTPIISFDVERPVSNPNEYLELLNWWNRSEPLALLSENIEYSLSVSSTYIEFQREGLTKEVVSVFGNDKFTATPNDPWITVEYTGMPNSDIKVSVAKNDSGSVRNGTILVEGEHGIKYTISVKQDVLSTSNPVYIGSLEFGNEGGKFQIHISTEAEWKLTVPSWIIIQTTGKGPATLTGQLSAYEPTISQDYQDRIGDIYFETINEETPYPKTLVASPKQHPKLIFEIRFGGVLNGHTAIQYGVILNKPFEVRTHPNLHWIIYGSNDITSIEPYFDEEERLFSMWPCKISVTQDASFPLGWLNRDPEDYWPCSQMRTTGNTSKRIRYFDGSVRQYVCDCFVGKGTVGKKFTSLIQWKSPDWSKNHPIYPRAVAIVGKFDEATETTLGIGVEGVAKNIRMEDLHQYKSKFQLVGSYDNEMLPNL